MKGSNPSPFAHQRGTVSHGNASVIWQAIQSTAGFAVTLVLRPIVRTLNVSDRNLSRQYLHDSLRSQSDREPQHVAATPRRNQPSCL
jgi:hypothetical protein